MGGKTKATLLAKTNFYSTFITCGDKLHSHHKCTIKTLDRKTCIILSNSISKMYLFMRNLYIRYINIKNKSHKPRNSGLARHKKAQPARRQLSALM